MKTCTTRGLLAIAVVFVATLEILSRNIANINFNKRTYDIDTIIDITNLTGKTNVYVDGEHKTKGFLLFDGMGCGYSRFNLSQTDVLEVIENISLIVTTKKGYIDVCQKINKHVYPLLESSKTLMELTAVFAVAKFLLIIPFFIYNTDNLRLFPFILSVGILHALGTGTTDLMILFLKLHFYEIIGLTKYEAIHMNNFPTINTNLSYMYSMIVDFISHLLFIHLIFFAWRKRNNEIKKYGYLSFKLID
uniref:Uncharacterized protein n=1 Tax=Strongyloides venezuelensis TaxID=75913 RepID=A0A0K0FXQ1_STRVS